MSAGSLISFPGTDPVGFVMKLNTSHPSASDQFLAVITGGYIGLFAAIRDWQQPAQSGHFRRMNQPFRLFENNRAAYDTITLNLNTREYFVKFLGARTEIR
jgi:hypothetical protein